MVKNRNAFALSYSVQVSSDVSIATHLSKREIVSDGPAGRENCIGQKLAYMEFRTVVALLASKYDFKFASEKTLKNIINDTKDSFSIVPGQFDLIFQPRKTA